MSLYQKVVLITGGARGIGKTIAMDLFEQGFALAIVDMDEPGAVATAEEINGKGGKAAAFVCNVTDEADVKTMVKAVKDEFGRIDVLINNAGITKDTLILKMKPEEWDTVLSVNLKGAFLCTKSVAREMMKQRSGKIINISSVVGQTGNVGQANYGASKAGLISLTKTTALEFASRGITANAVAPGFILTDMTHVVSDAAKEAFMTRIPLKRAGTPTDVAHTVRFLASELSDYITGQTIHVNGGMVMI